MTDRLGAQGTVLAGGRYDGLIESLGGPHTPAVGWAAGIERLAMLTKIPVSDLLFAIVIPMGAGAQGLAVHLTASLRRAGVTADLDARGNLKKRLARASERGAESVIIIGDDEVARGEVQVKNLRDGKQSALPIDRLVPMAREAMVHFLSDRDWAEAQAERESLTVE